MSRTIDAHQHFWAYDAQLYPWIGDGMAVLARDFLPGDLQPLLAAAGVEGSVAVQARRDAAETAWLLELAEANPWILGVVGWVDLDAADLDARLEAMSGTRLCGVREVLQDEPPEWILRPGFRRGVGRLAAHGLTYDLLLFPEHLPNALALVEENPDLRFVVDHAAKPRIREGLHAPWDQDLRRLAAAPNVWCKVSGLVTEAAWDGWERDDFRAYLDVVFDAFGVERLMYGSDWPVCTLAAGYAQVYELVVDYAGHLDAGARAGLFGGNAARFYGLDA